MTSVATWFSADITTWSNGAESFFALFFCSAARRLAVVVLAVDAAVTRTCGATVNTVMRLPPLPRKPLPSALPLPPPRLPLPDSVDADDVRVEDGDAEVTISAHAPRFIVVLFLLSSQLLIAAASFKLLRREGRCRVLTNATHSLDGRWPRPVEHTYCLHQYCGPSEQSLQ